MNSTVTGDKIISFPGAMTFSNGVTYSIIETEKNYEFYVTDHIAFNVEDHPEFFIGMIPAECSSSWEAIARCLSTFCNSPKLSKVCQDSIKSFYNDYYKNEDFFTKLV